MNIETIAAQFAFEEPPQHIREFGSGHINRTFLAEGATKQYVIQQINTHVFKDPDALMENVFAVTEFLRERLAAAGGDPERETLHFVCTKDGEKCFKGQDGTCWRAYRFVADSVAYDTATPALMQKSGVAFGRFQKMLDAFPADTLHETIAHFHDTPWRFYHEFDPAVQRDARGRAHTCRAEIDEIIACESLLYRITDALTAGSVPLRVTHNDTKLNNVLFDRDTDRALAVIDLDTVMPGSALYDFGDAIRFGAASAAEDAPEGTDVQLDVTRFKAYAEGYLSEAGGILTATERSLLPYAAWLITFECGMRFLTDYLNGDVYFKTDYPAHNLVRARNQLALARDIREKSAQLEQLVASLSC